MLTHYESRALAQALSKALNIRNVMIITLPGRTLENIELLEEMARNPSLRSIHICDSRSKTLKRPGMASSRLRSKLTFSEARFLYEFAIS
jgi:hypothetical protein